MNQKFHNACSLLLLCCHHRSILLFLPQKRALNCTDTASLPCLGWETNPWLHWHGLTIQLVVHTHFLGPQSCFRQKPISDVLDLDTKERNLQHLEREVSVLGSPDYLEVAKKSWVSVPCVSLVTHSAGPDRVSHAALIYLCVHSNNEML